MRERGPVAIAEALTLRPRTSSTRRSRSRSATGLRRSASTVDTPGRHRGVSHRPRGPPSRTSRAGTCSPSSATARTTTPPGRRASATACAHRSSTASAGASIGCGPPTGGRRPIARSRRSSQRSRRRSSRPPRPLVAPPREPVAIVELEPAESAPPPVRSPRRADSRPTSRPAAGPPLRADADRARCAAG